MSLLKIVGIILLIILPILFIYSLKKGSTDYRFFVASFIFILLYQVYFTTLIALPPKQKSTKDSTKYDLIFGYWKIPPENRYEYPDLMKEVIPSLII